MGYGMRQMASDFHIDQPDQASALEELQRWADLAGHIAFVDRITVTSARSLTEALEEFGWVADLDVQENICHIEFGRENSGEEDELFDRLAPYVQPGSYIEMAGEDGERWRWTFDGRTCKTVKPEVRWTS